MARVRAAIDRARETKIQFVKEVQKGCGALCQLREFVRGNRKIASDAHEE